MKKLIITSSILLVAIGGVFIVSNQKQPDEQPNAIIQTAPEPVQSVIEHETVIDAPEEVEAVVEAVKAPVENKVVEIPEPEVINREPTFEELVEKYEVTDEKLISILKFKFDRRINYPENHPLLRTKPKDMHVAEYQFIYFLKGR